MPVQFTTLHTARGPIAGIPTTLAAMSTMWRADIIRVCTQIIERTLTGSFSDIKVQDLKTMNRASLESALIELAGFYDCTQYETSDAIISKLTA